ncbi:MAG: CoA-binding protein [Epulopiscium sp.]|nr:CoA-binding protein [Candidatus Epulonipiscium sp.]
MENNIQEGKRLLGKKVWAVVGATTDTDKYGYKIYKALKDAGYTVYPISPKYEKIDGDQAYKTLSDLPETPQVVDFVVNPRIGVEVVKECKQLGIKDIWLQPGTVSDEILEYAQSNDINALQACVLVALKTIR